MPYFNEPDGCRGWWTSRTGLEQKLVILSTILFILAFSLTISTIVYKNRSSKGDTTTVPPPTTSPVTGETTSTAVTSPNTDSTASSISEPSPTPPSSPEPSPSTSLATSPEPPSSTTESTTPAPATSPKSPVPEVEKAVPLEKAAPLQKSIPLMSLLKEANRVNEVLEKQKLAGA